MEDVQADVLQLRYLNKQHEEATAKLNEKLMELGQAKSRVVVLDAEVKKLTNMQNLLLENIRIEKKIFDANRR